MRRPLCVKVLELLAAMVTPLAPLAHAGCLPEYLHLDDAYPRLGYDVTLLPTASV